MKKILIAAVLTIFSLTISAQNAQKKKECCNVLTKTISLMSSVYSKPSTEQSMFDEGDKCFLNAVEFDKKQTVSNFHTDLTKFLKESGIPEVKIIIPWGYEEKTKVYGIGFTFIDDGYKMTSSIVYNDQAKVCVIRVF